MRKSKALGKDILAVEVTHISSNGIWILAGDKELFLPYTEFPWFKDAPVSKIINVQETVAGHFNWRDLDVDLTLEIIEHPELFPLKAK